MRGCAHGERNEVVGGKDDELGSYIADPDIVEDDGIVKGDLAGNYEIRK